MVVVRFSGGLGNQLFQYAAGVAVTKQNGGILCADPWLYSPAFHREVGRVAKRSFEIQELGFVTSCRRLPNRTLAGVRGYMRIRNWALDGLRVKYRCPGYYQERFADLPRRCVLEGTFQDKRYLGDRFNEIIADVAAGMPDANDMRPLDGVLHVRRGDYLLHSEVYPAWFEEYNVNALRVIEQEFHCQQIDVFSDDIAWCRENLHTKSSVLRLREPDPRLGGAYDMVTMSKARVICIANSTFSWWSAVMAERNGARVIAPARWATWCEDPVDRLYRDNWKVVDHC